MTPASRPVDPSARLGTVPTMPSAITSRQAFAQLLKATFRARKRRPPNIRLVLWGIRATRRVQRDLETASPFAVQVPAPPIAHRAGGLGAAFLLTRATCLPRSLVRQRYQLALGDPRDVVIGVRKPFSAHAWVDGLEPSAEVQFAEITRLPANPQRRSPETNPSAANAFAAMAGTANGASFTKTAITPTVVPTEREVYGE